MKGLREIQMIYKWYTHYYLLKYALQLNGLLARKKLRITRDYTTP